jgi:chromosome partitioning protein
VTAHRTRYLVIANAKGGVGKSSVTVGLAAALAQHGRRVLVFDMDPTGSSTFHLAAEPPARGLADVLEGRAPLSDVIVDTEMPRLRLVPASAELEAWDRRPDRLPVALDRMFGQVPADVDVALLDLPPAALVIRAVLATVPAGGVLAVCRSRALDLVGLGHLFRLLDMIREQRGNGLPELVGVVPSATNRTRLSGDVEDELRREHGKSLLPSIRESAAVARAPLARKPLLLSEPDAPVLGDFEALALALIKRGNA